MVTDVLQEPVQGYERSRPSHASAATHTDSISFQALLEGTQSTRQESCSCTNQIYLI